jgi:hypothetical protein
VSRRKVICSLILGVLPFVFFPIATFHLFRRSPSRFPVDDHFKLLAEGTYAPPNVHALTLVVWAAPLSDPNPSFAASYQSYKSSAERILRGCGAYFVAYTSLHLVLGSPLPVHQSYPGDEEEAKQHTAFWVEALRHCDPSSFTFRVLPPQLSATGELYFPVDDITGTSLLKQCMVEHADTLAQPFLSFPDHLGIPFMRLALGRESEISDSLLEERLSLVVDTWANITQSAPPPVLHSTHAYLISGDPTISLSSRAPRSSVVGEL